MRISTTRLGFKSRLQPKASTANQQKKGQDKAFEARSLKTDDRPEEAHADMSPSDTDVATPRPGQNEPLSDIQRTSEKPRRHISTTNARSYTVSSNARSPLSTHDIEPETCAYIIKDGIGYHMPRSFDRGLGDRVLEMVGPWSSQNSLYKKLAFMSNDDMAALQTILTYRWFSDQTCIQVKALHRKPWRRKGSAILVILKDRNPRPFKIDEPMAWRPLRASNAGTVLRDSLESHSIERSLKMASNTPEPSSRLGNINNHTTGILEHSGAHLAMSNSSTGNTPHRDVQDVSTELMDQEDYIRELTTYRVWTIQQLYSQNINS